MSRGPGAAARVRGRGAGAGDADLHRDAGAVRRRNRRGGRRAFRAAEAEIAASPPGEEEEIRFDAEDEPDPLIDGRIDLGELAAEFVALGLDPYPRKPGVEFEAPERTETKRTSPFASLAATARPKRERE